MSDAVKRARESLEIMANVCSVDMVTWNMHSNAVFNLADENERLKAAIKCLPDYNVYRHEDFVDEYIKWLEVHGDTVGIKLEFIDYVPDNGRTVVRVVQKDNANS